MTSEPNSNTVLNVVGNSSSTTSNANSGFGRKRKSNDVGWEFGILIDEKNQDKVQYILCKKVFYWGLYRLKEHVANIQGNVAPCRMATNDNQLRCRQVIANAKNKKKIKKKEEEVLRIEVNIGDEEELEEIEGLGLRKNPKILGPMDIFASPINPGSSISGKNMQQWTLNDTIIKERTHATQKYLAKWVYQAGIPFNAIDNDSFLQMVEAIGRFGPSFKPPSQWQLREPFLKEEKRRSIMNLCVNCKEGTTFLSSKESSNVAHIGEHIFNYVLAAIEEVGLENVVQVVIDNTSNNMAAAKMLKEKMPSIFWNLCATHTINLMLEVGEVAGADEFIEPRKSGRNEVRDLEDEFESDNEAVEENV
ncbi:hypothetical protein EZV62_019527 [Acer yangbiense]|uniref:DUF659 domain-containing protein n=1 Tax=Acer yangbiense TaxID=1000413 RepID=A0A5C7HBJ9_9ROSI|nr:hypothetical protein EZV62_019527 [Acer yangbiense]